MSRQTLINIQRIPRRNNPNWTAAKTSMLHIRVEPAVKSHVENTLSC